MKAIAISAVGFVMSATAAAQSSVTIYGALDMGIRRVTNGDATVYSLSSNGNNTSRFGVKGIEDLGDGLKAGFVLESGITPDTGAQSDASRFWNRRSTVSLLGSFGELRIGRDYSVTYLGYEDYDVWSDIGITSVAKFDSSLASTRDTGVRADNQIVYFTPEKLGGFYGRLGVAAGEGVSGKKYAAGRGGYAAGPVDFSLTYGETTVTPIGGDDKFKTYSAGASYDLDVAKLSGYYQQSKFASLKIANYYIGAQAPIGRGLVRASYLNSNLSGGSSANVGSEANANDASQLALGYLFNLSKRTAVYTNVSRVTNKGSSAVVIDKVPAAAAGRNSTGFDLGLRHFF
jgi:predicted porin